MSCDAASNGFSLQSQYLLGPPGEQETEVTAPNGTAGHPNVYVNGSLIATYGPDAQSLYFHLSDWLGTRRALVNSSGVLQETYANAPFGDQFQAHPVTSS